MERCAKDQYRGAAFKTPETFLRAMIESVQAQTYGNWQLCLADGSGAGDEDADPKASLVQSIANEYASADARIKYECLTEIRGSREIQMRRSHWRTETGSHLWIMMICLRRMHCLRW